MTDDLVLYDVADGGGQLLAQVVRAPHDSGDGKAVKSFNPGRAGRPPVNGALDRSADAPFGGFKDSGIGRQNGDEGFEQCLETMTIASPL